MYPTLINQKIIIKSTKLAISEVDIHYIATFKNGETKTCVQPSRMFTNNVDEEVVELERDCLLYYKNWASAPDICKLKDLR